MVGASRRSYSTTVAAWRSITSAMPWLIASSRQLPAEGPLYSLISQNQSRGIRFVPVVGQVSGPDPVEGHLPEQVQPELPVGLLVVKAQEKLIGAHRLGFDRTVRRSEKGVMVQKMIQAEPLAQLHDRAGFRLGRGQPLAHLLLGSGQPDRLRGAQGDVDRYLQPPGVDAHGFEQDVFTQGVQPFLGPNQGLFRGPDLILIIGVTLGRGGQVNSGGHFILLQSYIAQAKPILPD